MKNSFPAVDQRTQADLRDLFSIDFTPTTGGGPTFFCSLLASFPKNITKTIFSLMLAQVLNNAFKIFFYSSAQSRASCLFSPRVYKMLQSTHLLMGTGRAPQTHVCALEIVHVVSFHVTRTLVLSICKNHKSKRDQSCAWKRKSRDIKYNNILSQEEKKPTVFWCVKKCITMIRRRQRLLLNACFVKEALVQNRRSFF